MLNYSPVLVRTGSVPPLSRKLALKCSASTSFLSPGPNPHCHIMWLHVILWESQRARQALVAATVLNTSKIKLQQPQCVRLPMCPGTTVCNCFPHEITNITKLFQENIPWVSSEDFSIPGRGKLCVAILAAIGGPVSLLGRSNSRVSDGDHASLSEVPQNSSWCELSHLLQLPMLHSVWDEHC